LDIQGNAKALTDRLLKYEAERWTTSVLLLHNSFSMAFCMTSVNVVATCYFAVQCIAIQPDIYIPS
jgi:hypothetical protein